MPRDRALSMVFGLTLGNEGSVRDWLRHGTLNVTQGKNFDRSGSVGPWIVPADDVDPGSDLHLMTRINGELRQDDHTARLTWDFSWLIEYITKFATLKPGDLIFTGTPVGAGGHQTPPKWLMPGDVLEVEVPEIGVLKATPSSTKHNDAAGIARVAWSGDYRWRSCSSVSPARSMTACSRSTPARCKPDGIELNFIPIEEPRPIFDRMSGGQEFDVAEYSSSEFVQRFANKQCPFVAIPIFPSRAFRHGFIAINRKSGIAKPKDLEGKRVGVPLYTMTAAIFIRGLLQHEYRRRFREDPLGAGRGEPCRRPWQAAPCCRS